MSRLHDGVDDFGDFTNVSFFNGLSSLSYTAWMAPRAWAAGNISVVRKNGTVTFLQRFPGNFPAFTTWAPTLRTHSATNVVLSQSTARWFYVGAMWSTSVNAGSPTLFVSTMSSRTMQNASTGAVNGLSSGTVVMRFGATETSTEDYNGHLAWISFYNRALSPDETEQLRRFPGSLSFGLLALYPFCGNSGPEHDFSGRGQPSGTLTGTTTDFGVNPPINGMYVVPAPGYAV